MLITEIQKAISDLPESKRGTLAAGLLDSLPPHGREDVGAEGIEEAARRREKLDSGKVRPHPCGVCGVEGEVSGRMTNDGGNGQWVG